MPRTMPPVVVGGRRCSAWVITGSGLAVRLRPVSVCSLWYGGWHDETDTLKRSNAPIFWALFGAGGMLSALLGPMLVFITGLAMPLGLLLPPDTMSYPKMLAFAQNWHRQGLHLRDHRALPVARRAPHLPQPARYRHSRRYSGRS
jgi:hypothetical protein